MSHIIIAVPTLLEAEPIRKALGTSDKTKWLITGMGPAEAALHITRALCARPAPAAVILAGIAGAYRGSGIKKGQVCIAVSESFGDLGRCTTDGIEPVIITGESYRSEVLNLSRHINRLAPRIHNLLPGIAAVSMTTVSCSSGSQERAKVMEDYTGAAVENMEGAAAALCCREFNVPFMEIRGISNMVGEADRTKWRIQPVLADVAAALQFIISSAQEER